MVNKNSYISLIDDELQYRSNPAAARGNHIRVKDLMSEFGNIYNVKAYGAMGDGTTDDTEAIQEAIYAAYREKLGGAVTFPASHYIISAPLYSMV